MSKGSKSGTSASKAPPLRVFEQIPPAGLPAVGVHPSTLLFPEWVDLEINQEKWDLPKTADKGKGAALNVPPPTQYLDPHIIVLPSCLQVKKWSRPKDIFPTAKFIMYKDNPEYHDLISGSKHILHSDFMRSFISAVGILEYLGYKRPSSIEFVSPTYVPNTADFPWKPWHHIYSMCKAGKGQKHNPQVNTLGKYVVRLYWMGCWRKLFVDDLLPVNDEERICLPSLKIPFQNNATDVIEIEMWPYILSKALLKLNSLSSTQFQEMLDFDIIQCLTGWYCQNIDVEGINIKDIWDMCIGFSDHYAWPEVKKVGSNVSSQSKKGAPVEPVLAIPYYLLATCSDMRTLIDDQVPDISPCWSHSFLIDQTREIPLIKPEPLPELARWKRFRWRPWAICKGIWPAPELIPIKCLKMVSTFRQCADDGLQKSPSKECIDISKNVAAVENMTRKPQGASKPSTPTIPKDPSIWGDFNKLGPYISRLCIYFKPSTFAANIRLTNIAQSGTQAAPAKGKAEKGKPQQVGPQTITWNSDLLISRNEPIYIFADSQHYKLLVINLAQVGNGKVLDRIGSDEGNSCYELNCAKDESDSGTLPKWCSLGRCADCPNFERAPFSYVVIETYNWQTSGVNDLVTFLNSYGTKTTVVDLKPGRFVGKMWLKSDSPFFMNVLSDSQVTVGTLETILESMRQDPERLLKLCDDVSGSYGQLVQKFGTIDYPEAVRNFSKSFMPEAKLNKVQAAHVRTVFVDKLLELMKSNYPAQQFKKAKFYLKVLLLDPFLGERNADNRSYCYGQLCTPADGSDEELDLIKMKERAAVKVQAFFKRIFVRRLVVLHKQTHPEYLSVFDGLKGIYNDFFSVHKRMTICASLISGFLLSNPDMKSLKARYSISSDLNNHVHFEYFTGISSIEESAWVPMARYTFYCNRPYPVVVKVAFFCELPKYIVRIFNNDDGTEVQRHTNNAAVRAYDNNALGYTVLCYGWSETRHAFCKWKLDFITLKRGETSPLIIPDTKFHKATLKDNYVPNFHNYVCRCTFSIKSDVFVTFRISTSHPNIKLHLRCVNEVGQLFGEIRGMGSVILPHVNLKYLKILDELVQSSPVTMAKRESRVSQIVGTSPRVSKRRSRLLSSDKYSLRGSTVSIKKNVSMSTTLAEVKYKDTIYIVEAFVLNETWPLTKKEWKLVEEIKINKLVVPIKDDPSNITVSFSKLGVGRRSKDSRKSLEKRSTLSEIREILEPMWCLETLSNFEDALIPIIDKRREEEIKDIKRRWYQSESGRYQKSRRLRDGYLTSHYIPNECIVSNQSFTSTGNTEDNESKEIKVIDEQSVLQASIEKIDEETRTIQKPVSITKILPDFDIQIYMDKSITDRSRLVELAQIQNVIYEFNSDEKLVKTAKDEEQLVLMREQKIEEFENSQLDFQDDMEKYLCAQHAKYELLNLFYTNCRENSAELMREAYDMRQQVIDRMLLEESKP